MCCKHVQGLFSEIYDGVATDQAQLIAHIQGCAACTLEYDRYCQFLDEVRQLPEPDFPFFFHELTMRNVSEHVPPGDQAIDELIEVINMRDRIRDRRRKRTRKASQAVSRWAGIGVAACLLLVSFVAVRAFDLPSRMVQTYDAPAAYAIPEAFAPDAAYGFDADVLDDEDFAAEMFGTWPDEDDEADDTAWSQRDLLPVATPMERQQIERVQNDLAIAETEEEETAYDFAADAVAEALPDVETNMALPATAPTEPITTVAAGSAETNEPLEFELPLSDGTGSLWPVALLVFIISIIGIGITYGLHVDAKRSKARKSRQTTPSHESEASDAPRRNDSK